jgi:hypothetical protein
MTCEGEYEIKCSNAGAFFWNRLIARMTPAKTAHPIIAQDMIGLENSSLIYPFIDIPGVLNFLRRESTDR